MKHQVQDFVKKALNFCFVFIVVLLFFPTQGKSQQRPISSFTMGSFVVKVESFDSPPHVDLQKSTATGLSGYGWIAGGCFQAPLVKPIGNLVRRPFEVVGNVINSRTQISIAQAQLISPDIVAGQTVDLEVRESAPLAEISKEAAASIERLLGQRGEMRVRFENVAVKVNTLPTQPRYVVEATAGKARYPAVVPGRSLQSSIAGFTLTITGITFGTRTAMIDADVELPDSIVDPGAGRPAHVHIANVAIDKSCNFHVDSTDSYGPWAIGSTGIVIQGKGWSLDLDKTWSVPGASGPAAPISWQGMVLQAGKTVPATSKVISNIGYLQAPYTFSQGQISQSGLDAELRLAQPFAFIPLEPVDYEVKLLQGKLAIVDSRVAGGSFSGTDIGLPKSAVRTQAGGRARISAPLLTVRNNLELDGAITDGDQNLQWGELTKVDAPEYNAAAWRSGYFFLSAVYKKPYWPLDGSGNFSGPDVMLPPQQEMSAKGMQGALLYDLQKLDVLTQDSPGHHPLPFAKPQPQLETKNPPVPSWMHVANDGVNAAFLAFNSSSPGATGPDLGDPTYRPYYVSPQPFKSVPEKRYQLNLAFVTSSVYQSDMSGALWLKGPANLRLPFRQVQLTSTANLPAGKVDLSSPVTLDYWGVGLGQNPGASSAGVMSIRTGQIILTAAGITEPKHFSKPFFLSWGEMLTDGNLGRLFFDYNNVGQAFDGFFYTPSAIKLSPYDPAVTTAYLQVGGDVHFDFFGAKYLNIQDYKDTDMGYPHFGRRIVLSDSSEPGFQATDRQLVRNWSDLGNMQYKIDYSDASQDGFLGVGKLGLGFIGNGTMTSSINLNRGSICMSVREDARHDFTLGPIANFGSLSRITGCMCLEGGTLKRMVLSSELEAAGNVNVLLRSASYGNAELSITPAIWQFNVNGDMYLGILAFGDVELTGGARFTVDRAQSFVEGELDGKLDAGTAFGLSSLSGNGTINWHLGSLGAESYQTLQGRLAVQIVTPIAGTSAEGGFYIGLNSPKSEAWVLQDPTGRFNLNTSALPDRLNGIYGYARYSDSLNLWIVSGGYEAYVGLGGFVLTPAQAVNMNAQASGLPIGLPYAVGNLGLHVWGDILGGIVSAGAWGDFNVIGPYPFSFEGTLGLEGCALWVACASCDVSCGLNSSNGFFVN